MTTNASAIRDDAQLTTTVREQNPPRDPEQIAPSEHFLRRFSNEYGPSHETRREPEITSEVVEACVLEGTISPGHGETLLYETEIDGYEWRLVVGFNDHTPVAVTAYCPSIHRGCNRGDRQ